MLEGVFLFMFMKDVMRTFCIFSFLFFLDTMFFLCDSEPCTHVVIYIKVVIIFFHLSLQCVVSFLSLFTCFLFIVCNLFFFSFCFTLRYHDEFCLKVFQKYRLSKSFIP